MIYFDHAATGLPKSEGVINAVNYGMRFFGNPGRGIYENAHAADKGLFSCRESLSKMFGTVTENCVLTQNTTEALNIAIKGFVFGRKGVVNVLTSDYNHNAVTRIFTGKGIKQKAKIKVFKCNLKDDAVTLENFKKALTRDISLVVLIHASNVCGRIFPVKEMVALAKENGCTVITDVAQTAGVLDIKAGEYGDILCMPGHKGLYGPLGTGAMIVDKSFKTPLRPFIDGGTGVLSSDRSMPEFLPERFEAGTKNAPGFYGLYQAVKENGFKDQKKIHKIFEYLVEELKSMKGITLIGAPDKGEYNKWMPIILFNVWGSSGEKTAYELSESNIAVRSGLHCAPDAHKALGSIKTGGVRISAGRGNTMLQAKTLIDAVARQIPC